MKMTKEQFATLLELIRATAEHAVTKRSSGPQVNVAIADKCRAIEAARALLVEDEEPEDEVSEGERVLRDAAANMVDRANELAAERSAAELA